MTTTPTPVVTTVVRNNFRAFAASAVASLVTWLTAKWGGLHLSATVTSIIVPAGAGVYFAVINYLEKKFPKLGWLLGVLPQPKTPAVVPVVAPPVTPAVKAVKAK